MKNSVYNTAHSMGENATGSISSAISKVANLVENGIDTQPRIRPILDLSDIRSGAGSISGIFGMTPSVGVMSNVRAINSMMSNQNGVNDDVISAIEKLGSSLGNTSGDTYHVDGITYDDGSNVADAVKTLVRAAKVGRRA